MERDEALYEIVAQEIARGEIRQGLWAKALSEEEYDEQRAKALYIKLRVKSLDRELKEAEHQGRLEARELEKQNAEQEHQARSESLQWRIESLGRLQKSRSRVRAAGFWLAFLPASAVAFPNLKGVDEAAGLFGQFAIAIVIGVVAGALGFVIAEVVRWFMPSQRFLAQEETQIDKERQDLEWARMSPLRRGWSTFINIVLGLLGLMYILWLAIRFLQGFL